MSKYILSDEGIVQVRDESNPNMWDKDEKFEEAAKIVIENGVGSASLIQRRLEVGYTRAARLLDQLEEAGIISHAEGNKPRTVIVSSFEEFLSDGNTPPKPDEVYPEDIKVEWTAREIPHSPFAGFQKEFRNTEEIRIPVGLSKKKIVSLPISEAGHIYVFNSPLCNSTDLHKNILETLINTYSPDTLKLIIADDTRSFASSSIANAPHLLTTLVDEQRKIHNALAWCTAEVERRFKIFQETGADNYENYNRASKVKLPRIICVVNNASGGIAYDGDSHRYIERLVNSGHLAGIHLIVSSPLADKKYSKIVTAFPTKIIFKTFSTVQADFLGTDDAFGLTSGDEFVFVPAYGEIQKLKVNG